MQWRYQMWGIKALKHDSNWMNKDMGLQTCQLSTKESIQKDPQQNTNEHHVILTKWSKYEIITCGSWVSHTNKKRWLVHQDISQS